MTMALAIVTMMVMMAVAIMVAIMEMMTTMMRIWNRSFAEVDFDNSWSTICQRGLRQIFDPAALDRAAGSKIYRSRFRRFRQVVEIDFDNPTRDFEIGRAHV